MILYAIAWKCTRSCYLCSGRGRRAARICFSYSRIHIRSHTPAVRNGRQLIHYKNSHRSTVSGWLLLAPWAGGLTLAHRETIGLFPYRGARLSLSLKVLRHRACECLSRTLFSPTGVKRSSNTAWKVSARQTVRQTPDPEPINQPPDFRPYASL
jgi:hypothetical protein